MNHTVIGKKFGTRFFFAKIIANSVKTSEYYGCYVKIKSPY